jgi:hypothetical protein
MAAFEQGGCEPRCKTKKELKENIKAAPESVFLSSTSAFGGWSGYATDLPDGTTFNVVGPDPYTARNWYASIKKGAGGKLVVT